MGRRMLRIFPIYFLLLLLFYLINVQNIKTDIAYLATYTYTYNYQLGVTNDWSSVYAPFWSLAVEEQFYLIFPLIALTLRKNLKLLTVAIFVIIIFSFLQIQLNVFNFSFPYVGLVENMGALCIGALGAVLIKINVLKKKYFESMLLEILTLVSLILSLIYMPFRWLQKISPVVAIYFILKGALQSNFRLNFINVFLLSPLMIKLGKISCGIYLYHMFISYLLADFVIIAWHCIPFPDHGLFHNLYFNDWILRFPLLVGCTILISSISFKYFERCFLVLKDRILLLNCFN